MSTQHPLNLEGDDGREARGELWARITAAGLAVHKALDEGLPGGVSSADYSILSVLRAAPHVPLDHQHCHAFELRLKEICDLLQWDRSRASHQVIRMEKRNLVAKHPCSRDARGVVIRLTEQGQEIIEKLHPQYLDAIDEVFFSKLDAEEICMISSVVDRVLGPQKQKLQELA